MRKLKNNKKGAGVDNLWAIVVLFGLAIFFITLTVVWNAFSNQAEIWTGSSIGTKIQNDAQTAVNQFDWIYVLVWFGFHLGILAVSFLLRTHPAMYIIGILIIAITVLLAAPLSNAYDDLTGESDLISASNSMPMTGYILDNLPKLEMIWGFLTLIILLGLAKSEGFIG